MDNARPATPTGTEAYGQGSPAARPSGVRQIFAAGIGNMAEWYDWYIYTFLTPIFASQIFPGDNALAQSLSSFAIFAVGFFLRPIGGLLIGALADRWGRRNTLTLTILAMGAASLIIAVTPSYASAGILAPIILVFARLLSGLSIGGEFAANTTFLVESAPANRRGF
jgi:MHS family alpha-ketoglutarate permease-like MFS transporter